ncbi:Rab GTPase-binding exocyst subunit SEC15 ASCRUDRAFT_77995 [Ascoidea rubescens DSM 1968]|uniref:Exocyst complex subunit EXOC6/Sec15 C-terminal domain-containing protein n=1 Tax=Ascoidea rubescens DSM 1968 TaxID=1344418 RepID=A0A1D2V9G9_9ASCO|nr:hypothetical protein ASCRUDRAFT_77995 [Ascoidea rubescens DSM 1968]ODV58296.1 hypothetical protein ASCRUDRAFT_77995 [Ascoidea rubescens DSM 1968]
MENFEFNIIKLYDQILILLFERYQLKLLNNFEIEYKNSLDEDDSMPMIINDTNLYNKILAVSWYNPDDNFNDSNDNDHNGQNSQNFSRILPFSQVYPMTCAQLRSIINKNLKFLEFNFYNYNFFKINQLLINFLKQLMLIIVEKMNEKLKSTSREEIAQNLINLEYFLISAKEVHMLITSTYQLNINDTNNKDINGNEHISISLSDNLRLIKNLPKNIELNEIIDKFIETKKNAENALFTIVDSKIDGLMDFFEWEFDTLESHKGEVSISIRDVGEFLKTMFETTFINIPLKIKNLLIIRGFDRLIGCIAENLIEDSKIITDVGINNFEIDLKYIEELVESLTTNYNHPDNMDNNEKSLHLMFKELNQIILLLKTASYEEFRNDQNSKYNLIKKEIGYRLLNKYKIGNRLLSDIILNSGSSSNNGNSSDSGSNNGNRSPRSPSSTVNKFSSKFYSRFRSNK